MVFIEVFFFGKVRPPSSEVICFIRGGSIFGLTVVGRKFKVVICRNTGSNNS